MLRETVLLFWKRRRISKLRKLCSLEFYRRGVNRVSLFSGLLRQLGWFPRRILWVKSILLWNTNATWEDWIELTKFKFLCYHKNLSHSQTSVAGKNWSANSKRQIRFHNSLENVIENRSESITELLCKLIFEVILFTPVSYKFHGWNMMVRWEKLGKHFWIYLLIYFSVSTQIMSAIGTSIASQLHFLRNYYLVKIP